MKNWKKILIIMFVPVMLASCGPEDFVDLGADPEVIFEMEKDIINRYLEGEGLPEDTTANGVRLAVIQQGAGEFVKEGDLVSFDFTGRTLVEDENGEVNDTRIFDTSIFQVAMERLGITQDNPLRYAPITYTYSSNGWTLSSLSGGTDFVPGFTIGVTDLLKRMRSGDGAMGDIILPSRVGFGPLGSFGVLEPNEIIIFRIENVVIRN